MFHWDYSKTIKIYLCLVKLITSITVLYLPVGIHLIVPVPVIITEIHVVMVDVKIDTLLKGGTFQLRESMFFDYFILSFQYRITPTPSSQTIKKRLWNGENRC